MRQKIKIKVWSDLHLEFSRYNFDHIHLSNEDDKDTTLILSGDIGVGTSSIPFIEEMCKNFKYVILICGNHEFYQGEINNIISSWQNYELDSAPKNFHFLYNDWRILDDVRFLGGTMWTNLADGDPIVMGACHRMMNDYAEIKLGDRYFTPEDSIAEHDKFITFLLQKFNEPFEGKTVVITHHSPGNCLKRKGRLGDRIDAAYFADIEELIGYHDKAILWCHGHTHRSWNYTINNTQVICNPYGYWGHATNGGFDRNLIVEI